MSDDVCCPVFNPLPWDEVTHSWSEKPFIMETIPQFMHMPLPGVYGKAVGRLWETAKKCGITPGEKDFLMLAYDPSPWKSELYLAVTGEHKDAKTVKMSGTFVSKVFDGPYNDIPKYMIEMEDYVLSLGKKVDKYYFYYTTCPKCAKKYGHNYIVALGKLVE